MTGAYYSLLEAVYKQLMKGRRSSNGGDRVRSLFNAARVVRRMMLRALDYCPPVDLQFKDYALAVFRADKMAYPVDTTGYRALWEQVMLDRKVVRKREELDPDGALLNSSLRKLDIAAIASSKSDAYEFIDANRAILNLPPQANIEVINLYRTQKISADDYRLPQEIVIEFVWSSEIKLIGTEFRGLNGKWLPLWCGGTLVFNRDGNLLHYTLKSDTADRRKELARYAQYLVKNGYLSLDDGERGLGAAVDSMHKVSASLKNGRLLLRRNAAMRHLACDHNH